MIQNALPIPRGCPLFSTCTRSQKRPKRSPSDARVTSHERPTARPSWMLGDTRYTLRQRAAPFIALKLDRRGLHGESSPDGARLLAEITRCGFIDLCTGGGRACWFDAADKVHLLGGPRIAAHIHKRYAVEFDCAPPKVGVVLRQSFGLIF